MRSVLRVLLSLIALVVAKGTAHAWLDFDAASPKSTKLELVVMESPGCSYCDIFRRDVLPAYEASERGKELPVRFVDVNDAATAKLELQTPVDIVPTFVIVKDNKEIGRIPGYVGPENFYHAINYLLSIAP